MDEITIRGAQRRDGRRAARRRRAPPPGGGPPALHRHAAAEIYRVQRGEFLVLVEDAGGGLSSVLARAGDIVTIPGGRAHTVRNESAADVLAYVVFAPGADMEGFVPAAAGLRSPEPADVLTLAERHGIEMAGPVPA